MNQVNGTKEERVMQDRGDIRIISEDEWAAA